jgi:hypothetical protein
MPLFHQKTRQRTSCNDNLPTTLWIHKIIPFLDVFEQDRLKQANTQFKDLISREEESQATIKKLTKELLFLKKLGSDIERMVVLHETKETFVLYLVGIAFTLTALALSVCFLISLSGVMFFGETPFLIASALYSVGLAISIPVVCSTIATCANILYGLTENVFCAYTNLQERWYSANKLGLISSYLHDWDDLDGSMSHVRPVIKSACQKKESELIKHQEMKKIAQHQQKAQAVRTPIVMPQHLLSYVMPTALEEPPQLRPHC